jgi:EAL domain-containing protein (putative c-di-GMP-specific phosphodiesterase class I)
MARALGLRSEAEGVETEAQAAFLSECGCDELQGFLVSPPVPAGAFARFLERDKAGE